MLEHGPAQALSNQQRDNDFHWKGFLAEVIIELGFKEKARVSLLRWPGEVSTRCTPWPALEGGHLSMSYC